MTTHIARACLCCLSMYLACLSAAQASVDICSDPETYSRLSAAFVDFDDPEFDQSSGAFEQSFRDYDLLFEASDEKYLFGAGHRYNIFDIDSLPVATNGHLHTTFFPFHVNTGDDKRTFRFSAALALSASSNLYKNSDEFDSDAIQVLAALVWGRRLSDRVSVRYGICGDHRFGEYEVYPVVSVLWQPRPDWTVAPGFPDSQLRYRISDALATHIRVFPDGNEWYVLDRSLTTRSQFVYESWAVEWTLDWTFLDDFTLSASLGRQLDNRYEMTLLDQSRVQLSSDPVTRLGTAIEWRF